MLPAVWVQIYLWLALIVLWTPVWWLARGLGGATGIGSATGWFVIMVGLFYGGLDHPGVRRRQRRSDPGPPAGR